MDVFDHSTADFTVDETTTLEPRALRDRTIVKLAVESIDLGKLAVHEDLTSGVDIVEGLVGSAPGNGEVDWAQIRSGLWSVVFVAMCSLCFL